MSTPFSKIVFGFLFFTSLNANAFSVFGIACDLNASDVEFAKTVDLVGAVEIQEDSKVEKIRVSQLHPNDLIYRDFEQLLMNEGYRIISPVFFGRVEWEVAFAIVQNIDSCQLELGLFDEEIFFSALADLDQSMIKIRVDGSQVRITKVGP